MPLNKNDIVHFYVHYVQSVHVGLRGGGGSEVEKVDKVLRGEGHGATVWVVGCAGMVCVLGKETKTHRSIFNLTFQFHSHFDQKVQKWENSSYLPEEDVAVCAEVQGVAVFFSVRIAAAQLKVHLLPLQLTFVRHHQALSDLKKK